MGLILFLTWMGVAPFLILFLPHSIRLICLDFALPIITSVLAWFLLSSKLPQANQSRRWNLGKSAILGLGMFIVCQSVVPIGYWMGWCDFTYGALQTGSALIRKLLLLYIPLTLIVTAIGYEWSLRSRLLSHLTQRHGIGASLMITSMVGMHLQWYRLFLSNGFGEWTYGISVLMSLFAIEFLSGALMISTGRLASAIIFHGFMRIIEMYIVGDVLDPYLPLMNFVSSNPWFYGVKAAVPIVLGILIVSLGLKRISSHRAR